MTIKIDRADKFEDCAKLLGCSIKELEQKVQEAVASSPDDLSIIDHGKVGDYRCLTASFFNILGLDLCFDYRPAISRPT